MSGLDTLTHTHTHTHTHRTTTVTLAAHARRGLITGGYHNGHVYYSHGDGSVEGHNVHQVSQQHSHNPLYVGNSEYCLSISEYVSW